MQLSLFIYISACLSLLKFSTCFTIKGTNNHAGGLVACAAMAVPQTLVIFFFDLGPGEAVGKLDPAVGLAQTQERLLEFKQVVYTVL